MPHLPSACLSIFQHLTQGILADGGDGEKFSGSSATALIVLGVEGGASLGFSFQGINRGKEGNRERKGGKEREQGRERSACL